MALLMEQRRAGTDKGGFFCGEGGWSIPALGNVVGSRGEFGIGPRIVGAAPAMIWGDGRGGQRPAG